MRINFSIYILFFISLFSCSQKEDSVEAIINAPSGFSIEKYSATSAKLIWKDESINEQGYIISRSKDGGNFLPIAKVDENAHEFIDITIQRARYEYSVCAYKGDLIGAEAKCSYIPPAESLPVIKLTSHDITYARINFNMQLLSDGFDFCKTGICWSVSPNPTIADNKIQLAYEYRTGDIINFNIPLFYLDASQLYYFRAYAINQLGVSYGEPFQAGLGQGGAAPAALYLPWEECKDLEVSMPEEVRIYKTSTTVNGRKLKAWYAIGDLSTGKIKVKTHASLVSKSASAHMSEDYGSKGLLLVNGGFFSTDTKSLLIEEGQIKSVGVATRTNSNVVYPLTRSAFGILRNGAPSTTWVFTFNGTTTKSYEYPNLNVLGSPQPFPNDTFPCKANVWDVENAVGGGPMLLRNSRVAFDFSEIKQLWYYTNYEQMPSGIFQAGDTQPRTAIGYTADKKVVLLVADGRQAQSDGLVIDELARIMLGIGCTDAINLDGGGSSMMVVNPGAKLVNLPTGSTTQRSLPFTVGFVLK